MKMKNACKRIVFAAALTFTLAVYLLYFFRSLIPSQEGSTLSISYLNGFLLFGALLGLTNVLTDRMKADGILKRLIHFFATAVNFFVSIMLATGYLASGNETNSPLTVPNRILYCLIAYVVVYLICVGLRALYRLIFCRAKKSEEYTSVLSK